MPKGAMKVQARDTVARAFEEARALLDCLREACTASGLDRDQVAVVLALVSERLETAQAAFDRIEQPA